MKNRKVSGLEVSLGTIPSCAMGETRASEARGKCSHYETRITAGDGILPTFYGKHGFQKETRVILMGREL